MRYSKIVLEEPCRADLDKMPVNNIGTYCAVCETSVVDFSKKSLEEIQDYFQNNAGKKVCGRYHNRHTQYSNSWYEFLNRIEFSAHSRGFRKVAMFLITILLLVTSCKTKKKTTRYTTGRFLSKEEYYRFQSGSRRDT